MPPIQSSLRPPHGRRHLSARPRGPPARALTVLAARPVRVSHRKSVMAAALRPESRHPRGDEVRLHPPTPRPWDLPPSSRAPLQSLPPRLRPRPSQPLTPRPGRDTSPAPPLAARGNTLTFPPPLVHPPGHPGVLPTPDSGISCRSTQFPLPHPCSTPSATLSSPRPVSSAAPSRGLGGPQPLLW